MSCGIRACKDEFPICRKCMPKTARLLRGKCVACGRTAASCDCPNPTGTRFLFFYGNRQSKRIVYAIKENADTRLADFLAELMISANGIDGKSYDAVTYVPRSARGIRDAGYDQAKLLARSVSKLLHIPLVTALVRVGSEEQKLLSAKERADRMKSKYRLSPEFENKEPVFRQILLIDDVYTTGATMGACCALLKSGVSKHVTPLAAAKTNRKKKSRGI